MDKVKAAAKGLQSLTTLLALMMTAALFFFILSWAWSLKEITEEKEIAHGTVFKEKPLEQKVALWDADINKGKALFLSNCASCHSSKMDKDLAGPALKGVFDRWERDSSQIFAFIKNSQAYIFSDMPKASYAKQLFYNNKQQQMTAFPHLKEEELVDLLAFIEAH